MFFYTEFIFWSTGNIDVNISVQTIECQFIINIKVQVKNPYNKEKVLLSSLHFLSAVGLCSNIRFRGFKGIIKAFANLSICTTEYVQPPATPLLYNTCPKEPYVKKEEEDKSKMPILFCKIDVSLSFSNCLRKVTIKILFVFFRY